MKAKIIALIEKIKNLFAARRTNMGPLPAHKPFIQQLAEEETNLAETCDLITQLDEAKSTFAASGLFYLIEKLVPVLRHWRTRLQQIPESHFDVKGHQKAQSEFLEAKETLFQLIEDLNKAAQPSLTPTIIETNSVTAIIKMFENNKSQYVQDHPIQVVKKPSLFNNCRMQ